VVTHRAAGHVQRYPEALLVAAIQEGFNKPGVDQRVISKMAEYISDRMQAVIRGAVLKKRFPTRAAASSKRRTAKC
jgi:hypothetical protein